LARANSPAAPMNPITSITVTSASLAAGASSSFNPETPDYDLLLTVYRQVIFSFNGMEHYH